MKKPYSTLRISLFTLFILTLNVSEALASKPILRLLMNTVNFNDETVFYFEQGGTTSFQSAFDAYKLINNSGTTPYLGSMSDSILTGINGLPELPATLSIPVKAITPATRTFTFSTDISEFNSFVCVTLFDAFTGISTNILTSHYVCTLYDTTSIARFTLNFYTTPLITDTTFIQATCSSPAGKITAFANYSSSLNYEWRKNDSTVKTLTSISGMDSLDNLAGGFYTLRINGTGSCSYFSSTFSVNTVVPTTASFSSYYNNNPGQIHFLNSSTNAQVTAWNFGDNSALSYSINPSHSYQSPGVYTVTLITESSTSCKDTIKKRIEVLLNTTGLTSFDTTEMISLTARSASQFNLKSSFKNSTTLTIKLMDLKGTVLEANTLQPILTLDQNLDLKAYTNGIYLLRVSTDSGTEKVFKIVL